MAFAVRTERSSPAPDRHDEQPNAVTGIAFELVFTAAPINLPPLQSAFGTAALLVWVLTLLAPMPMLVWALTSSIGRCAGPIRHPG
jgi:hypothetical protein